MERLDLGGAAAVAMGLVRGIDGYIERTAPFRLAKDPTKLPEAGAILYNCAETLRLASLLVWPFMPAKVEELWRRLGVGYAGTVAGKGRGDLAAWTAWGQLRPGTTIIAGEPLFPRYQTPGARGQGPEARGQGPGARGQRPRAWG